MKPSTLIAAVGLIAAATVAHANANCSGCGVIIDYDWWDDYIIGDNCNGSEYCEEDV